MGYIPSIAFVGDGYRSLQDQHDSPLYHHCFRTADFSVLLRTTTYE